MPRISLSKRLRFEILKRDSFKCQYCGSAAPDVLLQVDHVKPVAEGGTDDIWNLITSCQPCNSGKSDKQLSDTAAISKVKKQLDELQDRRDQLDMLMEWHNSLANMHEDALDSICDFWERRLDDQSALTPSGRDSIRKLIHKFSPAEVIEAIKIAVNQYCKLNSEGRYKWDSINFAFGKLSGICAVRRREQSDPLSAEAYKLRNIAGKHCPYYFNDQHALSLIKHALKCGVPPNDLLDSIYASRCWTAFREGVEDLTTRYIENQN